MDKGYTPPSNFRLAFGNASLNAKHEMQKEGIFFADLIYLSSSAIYLLDPKYLFLPK